MADAEILEIEIDPEPARPAILTRLAVLLGLAAIVGVSIGVLAATTGDADEGTELAELELGGPYDGLESIGLPVTAEPDVGLVDGQVVTVTGSGYRPLISVGVVQCWGPADGSGSVDNCDIGNYQLASTDEQGAFSMSMPVRRFIGNTTGEHDCAKSGTTAGCTIAAGNIEDYDESGAVRTWFDPEIAGVPAPTLVVEPDRGLVDGAEITVTGQNFVPGETARLTQCVIGGNDALPGCYSLNPTGEIQVNESGGFAVTATARRFVQGAAGEIDCLENPYGCRVVVTGEKVPNPIEIVFDGSVRPAPGPDYRVSPSDGLADGDTVHVEITGFDGTEGDEFVAQQCVDLLAPEVACGPSLAGVISDGAIVFDMPVTRVLLAADGSKRDCAQRGRVCYLRVETTTYVQERLPLGFASEIPQ